jgi:hypothetical protein
MAIGNARCSAATVYIYDENGSQIGRVSATGGGPEDGPG